MSTQAKTLDKAFHVQHKTIEALKNINEDLINSEEGGNLTLEDLKRQNYKLNNILDETDRLDHAQKEASRLQRRLGRWTMKAGGRLRTARNAPPKTTGGRRGGDPSQSGSPSRPFKPSTLSPTFNHSEHASNVQSNKSGILDGITILRETHASELKELDENDREIEGLLDCASKTLSNLADLQSNIASEIHTSKDTMHVIETNLEVAEYKQRRVNARSIDFLEGKYRNRGLDAAARRK